jgi:hypothetical protein
MQSQTYGIGYEASKTGPNDQKLSSTLVVSSGSGSEEEADQNAPGKRKRPMSVSYANFVAFLKWSKPDPISV